MVPGNTIRQEYGEFQCEPCGVFFPTLEAMLKHKADKRANDQYGHVHCRFCGMDFVTEEGEKLHIQESNLTSVQYHPHKQNLVCPGCNHGPFTRLAQLVEHIEKGHCPRLSADTLDDVRAKKMEFAKKLVALTNEPLKHDFSSYLQSKAEMSSQPKITREQEPAKPEPAKPFVKKAEEWPRLSEAVFQRMGKASETLSKDQQAPSLERKNGGIRTLVPSSRDENNPDGSSKTNTSQSEKSTSARTDPESAFMSTWTLLPLPTPPNQITRPSQPNTDKKKSNKIPDEKVNDKTKAVADAWSEKKNLFPDAWAPQSPSPRQLERATAPNGRAMHDAMDPDHPSHPHFDASRYYSEFVGKYTCPKLECSRCFKNARGLTSHLLTVHGNISYNCPNCFKKFYSLTALTAHVESSSQRCNIREADAFRAYVDQLTAGLVDVSLERYEDGTNQYVTAESAKEKFGPKKGPDGKKHVPGWE
ncbi:unnamed protein product [Clonostachys chloroleuca]|uniref:C2H2-type domain-containing protein n=1 Tax=Clonostachys chloroleuca TaxID=1926264 RepID=A0AA35Q5K6_9HYPO|nr:unnamed protein product [Clonostachys chloroleuca]